MATYIKTLVDNNNDMILPRTKVSAIDNDSNVSLQSLLDAKGTYSKPAGGIPDSDLAEAHYTEAEADALLAAKQDATDNNLQTVDKTVVGAINELKSSKVNLAQGIAKAGQFLVVGADGNVTTQTLQTWQGGSY